MSSKKFKQKPEYVKVERVKKEPSIRLKRLFASLFNNQAAFDGGRKEPWWLASILFIIAIVLALVPGMVMVSKTKGSDNLGQSLYHTEIGMVKFVEKLETESVDLIVREENGKNVLTNPGATFNERVKTADFNLSDGFQSVDVPYFAFIQPRTTTERDANGDPIEVTKDFEYLRVYYTGDILQGFLVGATHYAAENFLAYKLHNLKTSAATENVTSHIILGRDAIFSRIYNPNTLLNKEDVGFAFEGRTSSLPLNMNIRNFGKFAVDGVTAINNTQIDYNEKVLSNFKNMQDLAYKAVKAQAFWMQTGVYAAIFTLIGAVMGLIIFISTRGKHNPNRDVKFFESIKIGAWLLPTPGLLTLIVGLFMPNYFHMVFIMTIGIRSVWLTMRTLGPQQQ